MKQFNIEEYKKNPNRKVITRNGKSVRIVCTDMRGTYTVVAICKMDYIGECCYSYTDNGKLFLTKDTHLDLFFATEKKEGWINLVRNSNGNVFVATKFPYKDEEIAKSEVSDKSNVVATCKITWEE